MEKVTLRTSFKHKKIDDCPIETIQTVVGISFHVSASCAHDWQIISSRHARNKGTSFPYHVLVP
eukprot:1150041-Pelagomonas_calceolata.AAC.3